MLNNNKTAGNNFDSNGTRPPFPFKVLEGGCLGRGLLGFFSGSGSHENHGNQEIKL